MTGTTVIAVLLVGEFDNDQAKKGFEAIIRVFSVPGVELVISEPATNKEEARQFVDGLSKRDPDVLLIIPLRGLSAPVIEAAAQASQAPCLICPIQRRFALPSSALALGALRQGKAPVELLYAPPDSPEFEKRSGSFARAARAFKRIKQSRIGVIGGLFPNLVSCRYEPQILRSRLRVTLQEFSFEEIRSAMRVKEMDLAGFDQAQQQIIASYGVDAADRQALSAGLQLHLALKQLAREQNLDGFATECWSGFPRELGLNPCMGFIEDAYTLACEGDVMLCVSLLMVRHLTGSSAYVGDLYDLDMQGILTLVHCGAPASLAPDESQVVLGRSQLALERGFETLTCRPQLRPGPVTLFRLYGEQCDGLHLAAGELQSSEQSPSLEIKIRLEGNRWDFLDQCFGNHYVVVAGDIRKEIKLLGKWLDIKVFET